MTGKIHLTSLMIPQTQCLQGIWLEGDEQEATSESPNKQTIYIEQSQKLQAFRV